VVGEAAEREDLRMETESEDDVGAGSARWEEGGWRWRADEADRSCFSTADV